MLTAIYLRPIHVECIIPRRSRRIRVHHRSDTIITALYSINRTRDIPDFENKSQSLLIVLQLIGEFSEPYWFELIQRSQQISDSIRLLHIDINLLPHIPIIAHQSRLYFFITSNRSNRSAHIRQRLIQFYFFIAEWTFIYEHHTRISTRKEQGRSIIIPYRSIRQDQISIFRIRCILHSDVCCLCCHHYIAIITDG